MTGSADVIHAPAQHAAPVNLARFRGRGLRGEFIAGSPLHEWLLAGGAPEAIETPAGSVVRDGSRSRCARIERLDETHPLPAPLFFKAYRRRRGVQARLKRLIGWHMPSWVWRMSWRLIEAGVPVPRPWGYLTPQMLRFGGTSYFWSEWIAEGRTAMQLARSPETRPLVADEPSFAVRCAELLARLHGERVYHRDMNWGNLLVEKSSQRVWLIDLDSAHRRNVNGRAAACRDLARFLVDAHTYESPPEWCAAFLDAYSHSRGLSPGPLHQQVQAMLKVFLERRARRLSRNRNRALPAPKPVTASDED